MTSYGIVLFLLTLSCSLHVGAILYLGHVLKKCFGVWRKSFWWLLVGLILSMGRKITTLYLFLFAYDQAPSEIWITAYAIPILATIAFIIGLRMLDGALTRYLLRGATGENLAAIRKITEEIFTE